MPIPHPPPDPVTSLADHDAWTDARIPTLAAARADKHARMAADPFAFLRGSYPRWAQRVAVLAPDPPGPVGPAVGDLHVENFGTWRDGESRLVWGVNDLDEADRLPAAHDLLRLATRARLAPWHGTPAEGADVVTALLDGYAAAVASGGGPLVLDRPDPPPLVPLLPAVHGHRWWAALAELPPARDVPDAALDLLRASLPAGAGPVDLRARTAGMGSRDHLRIVAVARVRGAPTVREVKARTPPATHWLHPPADDAPRVAAALAQDPRRSPDPVLRITDGWVVRRLAPWSDRIELSDLHRPADVGHLLAAMGADAADVHLGGAGAAELARITAPTGRAWLHAAAERMLEDTVSDWHTWRDAVTTGRPPRRLR